MSQTVSIVNKPEGNGAASDKPEGNGAASDSRSHSRSHKSRHLAGEKMRQSKKGRAQPRISSDVRWRWDGEENQIIVVSKEDMPLPLILNLTAARIFSLCNGRNSLEGIARLLSEEFNREEYAKILSDVKKQVEYFLDKGIVEV